MVLLSAIMYRLRFIESMTEKQPEMVPDKHRGGYVVPAADGSCG